MTATLQNAHLRFMDPSCAPEYIYKKDHSAGRPVGIGGTMRWLGLIGILISMFAAGCTTTQHRLDSPDGGSAHSPDQPGRWADRR
jgi:hypothetical protein